MDKINIRMDDMHKIVFFSLLIYNAMEKNNSATKRAAINHEALPLNIFVSNVIKSVLSP